jgi:hypothetical protein
MTTVLSLAHIPTLRELYKHGALTAVRAARFPSSPALLDRVSLL